jgi:hypothetical protein
VTIARTIRRIAAILVTVGALTALAGVAQAQSSIPPGMSPAEYQALMLRSEALNQAQGLGGQTVAPVASPSTDPGSGFAWEAFGIGAAVMLGLALVAGGVAVRHATRRGLTSEGTT